MDRVSWWHGYFAGAGNLPNRPPRADDALSDPVGVVQAQAFTSRPIEAGEWEGLVFETGSNLSKGSWKVRVVDATRGLESDGLLDIDGLHNALEWTEE